MRNEPQERELAYRGLGLALRFPSPAPLPIFGKSGPLASIRPTTWDRLFEGADQVKKGLTFQKKKRNTANQHTPKMP